MTDIEYWDDTLAEELEIITSLINDIPKLKGMDKASAIDRAKAKTRSANGTKRSFKMEIRLIQDVSQRRKYEARLSKLDKKLKSLRADVKALESEMDRGELFVSGEGGGDENNGGEIDPTKAGDAMLKEANVLQDKTQDSLANTKNMISDSKEVGAATLEELERQREVLGNIEKETDRIDDNLARAEVLLKQFGKRMASDHFIQCFALVNCLLLLGVILYAVISGKSLTGDDDADIPFSPVDNNDNGDDNGRRMLFLRREE